MSPDPQLPATVGGHVIENPLSGERITILATRGQAGQSVLEWELVLAPGGRVPSSHAHPAQEESFTVLAGQLRFRVGGQRVLAGPGQVVRVPPGTVHHFANAGRRPARVAVQTSPALARGSSWRSPRPWPAHSTRRIAGSRGRLTLRCSCATSSRRCGRHLPAALAGAVIRPLAWLARRRGLDARYRALRARQASPPAP